jgi:DHA1 family arabinose polymer transporter-like MFS transporter
MVAYAVVIAGAGMTVGNFAGAKLAEKLNPLKAVLIALVLMAIGLLTNTYLASGKISIFIMTFMIGIFAFCVSTPIQLMMIDVSVESRMLGSSLNQSAFNIGNALGAFLAGLPIAFGYGFISADWVGAGLASCGIVIALVIMYGVPSKFPYQNA